jgi:hypothetical protein
MTNLSDMNVKELKSYIENQEANFGASAIDINGLQEIAEQNSIVKVHSFELNFDKKAYDELKNDTTALNFVFDANGYVHGINLKYFSLCGIYTGKVVEH